MVTDVMQSGSHVHIHACAIVSSWGGFINVTGEM